MSLFRTKSLDDMMGMLMAFLSRTTWAAFLTWLALGPVIYFAYARQRSLLN